MRPDHGVRVLHAKVRLISHCRDTLKSRHPEVYKSLDFAEEATMFFNDAMDLLPQDEWPTAPSAGQVAVVRATTPKTPPCPGCRTSMTASTHTSTAKIMTFDDVYGRTAGVSTAMPRDRDIR